MVPPAFTIISEIFNGIILIICVVRFIQLQSRGKRRGVGVGAVGAGKLVLSYVAVMALGELLGGIYKPLESLCMRGNYPDVCDMSTSEAARRSIDAMWLAADFCLFAAATMYNFDLLRRYGLVQFIELSASRFIPIMRYVYAIFFVIVNIANFLMILRFTDHGSLAATICGIVQALFYLNVIFSDLYISIRIIKTFSANYNSLDNNIVSLPRLDEGASTKTERIEKRSNLVAQLKMMVYFVCTCDVLAILAFLIGMKFEKFELEFTQFAAGAYVGHVLFGVVFLSKLKNAMGSSVIDQESRGATTTGV
ncbi:hypothetical protein HK104_007461 [Borealophlyctis nickersoniae]|nr:hypothetical protein HK104_007461 [Borealophlyctis nickersoniae]